MRISDWSSDVCSSDLRPGVLGVAILDLGTGEMKGVNAEKPMPMQSVFKLPLAIAVMDAADKGKLSLDDTVSLAREQLSVAHSPIAEAFPERPEDRQRVV